MPTKRTAPKQVIENPPEEFPILKSVRDHPSKVRDSEKPDARLKQKEVKTAFDNITFLFPFSDSDTPEKMASIPPTQDVNTDTLDFLMDQIDDMLTDIETLNPFTRI